MDALQTALRAIIQAEMVQDPAHDLAHVDRVWANAHRIARSEGNANLRVLMGAAYLHDLVNLPKDDPDRARASQMSAEAAAPILTDLGFTPEELAAAQHAIAAHSFSANIPPETPEARILRDADRLDALGATGIARTFTVGGTLGRALYDPSDPFAADRELNDQLYTIDHWHLKLLQLPKDMLTAKGRKIADKRARLMLAFLEQLAKETDTWLPDHWAELLR